MKHIEEPANAAHGIFGNFGRRSQRGGDRKTLPRNGIANWRAAQHAFTHPKIAILGTALVV
jgi:hypothetical protein